MIKFAAMGIERREIIPSEEVIIHDLPVIAVIGKAGSGKDTVCDMLHKKYGIVSFTVSDVIRDLLEQEGISPPLRRDQLRTKHNETVVKYGKTAFIRSLLNKAIKLHKETPLRGIAINGSRYEYEVEAIKRQSASAVICVSTEKLVRFERVRHRGRSGDIENLGQFENLDRETVEGNPKEATQADIVIDNNSSKAELEKKVIAFIQEKFPDLAPKN